MSAVYGGRRTAGRRGPGFAYSVTMTSTIWPRHLAAAAAAAALLFVVSSSPAAAQGSVGIRAGVSADPDQFYFGGHYDTGPLIDQLSFRPNLEVGLGDNVTTVALNFEFVYRIPIQRKPWSVYFGGGPAMIVYRYEEDQNGNRNTDTQPGFNLLIGLAHRGGLFAEAKLGLIDSPSGKFTIGYAWR
jgi:hypothetical protein